MLACGRTHEWFQNSLFQNLIRQTAALPRGKAEPEVGSRLGARQGLFGRLAVGRVGAGLFNWPKLP